MYQGPVTCECRQGLEAGHTINIRSDQQPASVQRDWHVSQRQSVPEQQHANIWDGILGCCEGRLVHRTVTGTQAATFRASLIGQTRHCLDRARIDSWFDVCIAIVLVADSAAASMCHQH